MYGLFILATNFRGELRQGCAYAGDRSTILEFFAIHQNF